MGAVYEVLDRATQRHRAIKIMNPTLVSDAEMRERFELEARITGNIDSDHIVQVSDAGVDEATGIPFLVMDLLRGEELGSVLKRRRALPREEVIVYLFQAALALDKTHRAGIVHRDLKPENMFITTRDDGSPCLKILDFGIAKVVEESNPAHTTRSMGTPLYMSPEQCGLPDCAIGPATDTYALAQIAYALLVGEPYWLEDAGIIYALLTKIVEGPVEPPTTRALRRTGVQLPSAFDGWFLKATAPRPEARFQRATTAILALAEALSVDVPRPLLATLFNASSADPCGPPPTSLPFARTERLAPVSGAPASPSSTVPLASSSIGPPFRDDAPTATPTLMTSGGTARELPLRAASRWASYVALLVAAGVLLAFVATFVFRSRSPGESGSSPTSTSGQSAPPPSVDAPPPPPPPAPETTSSQPPLERAPAPPEAKGTAREPANPRPPRPVGSPQSSSDPWGSRVF